MKNSIFAATFVFALVSPSLAMADNAVKPPVNETIVDVMTTQSISDQAKNTCHDVDGFPLKNNRCSMASQYPDNAFSGMNFGH